MVRQSYELSVPVEVVEQGLTEMPDGVRITIDCSVRLWRSKRMTASELESLLQSVAWQSSTLKQYFDDISRKKAAFEPEAFEVLSDDDMLSLFADSNQGPAKSMHASCQNEGVSSNMLASKQKCTCASTNRAQRAALEAKLVELRAQKLSLTNRQVEKATAAVAAHRQARHLLSVPANQGHERWDSASLSLASPASSIESTHPPMKQHVELSTLQVSHS